MYDVKRDYNVLEETELVCQLICLISLDYYP